MKAAPRILGSLAWLTFLAGCRNETTPPDNDRQAEAQVPALPVAQPPLDRRALLLAVSEAASAYAAGREDTNLARELDGKSFAIRLRFGCPGVQDNNRGWSLDEAERVLRINVRPDILAGDEIISNFVGSEPESIEGFWLRHPWLLDAACPAIAPEPTAEATGTSAEKSTDDTRAGKAPAGVRPDAPSAGRIGIAQLFSEEDSRTHRRDDRPYSATVRLAEGETPASAGYDLVLSGRLTTTPAGRVIVCHSSRSDSPPSCLVSARFDNVSLAKPDGEIIAEWYSR